MKETRKGMLLVISGPSYGTGKGTLAAKLLRDDPSFTFSVSVTTRAKRSNEIEDVHTTSLFIEEYDKLLAEDAFLEHATVHGHRYGTLKARYERMERGQNKSCWTLTLRGQGSDGAGEGVRERIYSSPSYKALRVRVHTRNTDDPAEIERRSHNARGEIDQMQPVSICNRQRRAGAYYNAAVRHCQREK